MSSHVIIAGTGRAGTTLLVQLLDAVGQNTTIGTGNIWIDEYAHGGLESMPSSESDPRFAKSPWAYLFIDELVRRKNIKLDAVIIPIRNIREAVSSRIIIELEALYRNRSHPARSISSVWREHGITAGGVTFSLEPIDQMRVLTGAFYETIEVCVRHDIPIVFLEFPRFAQDARYTFEKLSGKFLGQITYDEFEGKFRRVVSPEKIRVEGEITISHASSALKDDLPTLAQLDKAALLRHLLDEEKRGDAANSALEATRVELSATQAKLNAALDELSATRAAFDKRCAIDNSSAIAGLFSRFGTYLSSFNR